MSPIRGRQLVTVYAGASPNTGKPMYAAAADAPMILDWEAAMKYAKRLTLHGHEDWRVPTKSELNVLWQKREKGALKGNFNLAGGYPGGHYWASKQRDDFGRAHSSSAMAPSSGCMRTHSPRCGACADSDW